MKGIGRKLVDFFWGVTPIGHFIRICIYAGVVYGHTSGNLDMILGFYFIAAVTASMGYFIYMALEASKQDAMAKPKKATIKVPKGNKYRFKR